MDASREEPNLILAGNYTIFRLFDHIYSRSLARVRF